MPVVRYLEPEKIRTGDALLAGLFGQPGESFFNVAEEDQREALGDDVQQLEPRLPRKMDLSLNGRTKENFTRDKSDIIRREMNFGTRARFASERQSTDLKKPAYWIYSKLVMSSPVDSGRYKRHHVFTIEGRGVGGSLIIPTDGSISRVGIANRVEYAAVLDLPNWPQIYRKVTRAAVRRWGKDFDIRMTYTRGDAIGGLVYNPRTVNRKSYWPVPHIEIAPFGAFGGRIGIQARRGKKRDGSRTKRRK